MKYLEYIEEDFIIEINKCKICDYSIDHCDWGCPKANINNEYVTMKLDQIIIKKSEVIYKFKYNNNFYNIKENQIIGMA